MKGDKADRAFASQPPNRSPVIVYADVNESPARCYCPVCKAVWKGKQGEVGDAPYRWVDGHRSCYILLCQEHKHLAAQVVHAEVKPMGRLAQLRAALEKGRGLMVKDPEAASAHFLLVIAELVLEQAEKDSDR